MEVTPKALGEKLRRWAASYRHASRDDPYQMSPATARETAELLEHAADALGWYEARCRDCGMHYSSFGMDIVLPDDQWARIAEDGAGLLCGTCIARRAKALNLPGVTCLKMSFGD